MKIIVSFCLFFTTLFTPSYADDSDKPTKPSEIPVESFARLTDGSQMEMSPGISHIAYITPHEGRKHIMVLKLDGSHSTLLPPVKDADIMWFRWKNDSIMLISYRFTQKRGTRTTAFTRLLTYNTDTGLLEPLLRVKKDRYRGTERIGNVGDSIVDMLEDDPDHILLALDINYDGTNSIFKINVREHKRSNYYSAKLNITNWSVDEDHQVRWGTGYRRDIHIAQYLNPVTKKWEEVQDKQWYKEESIYPIKFFDDPRYAYVSSPNSKGINGLAKFDMVEGKIVEELFYHDTVDISGLITSPETGRVIGVKYIKHHPEIHFFSQSYKKLYQNINSAMGEGWSDIISMNLKKKTFLIKYMNSDTAGEYYLLDGNTGNLQLLLEANKYLPASFMAKVKPIELKARDALTIHGYLTLPKGKEAKNLPTVIFPHGGPGSRDTLSFDIWAQFFSSRGYAVLQPNFRGSTGYGDFFKAQGDKQWGGAMQDDVTDATNWLIKEGIADPAKTCIVGASYGGYAALMGAVKEPDLYKCAISINGVANLPSLVTHTKKYVGGRSWIKDIGLEGEKIKSVSPYHQAEKIKIPILIVHAKDDPVVPYRQGKDIARKLKKLKKSVTYVEVKNGDHFLDTAEARLAAFKAMEIFLKEHLD